jgi:hypothetical protein
MRRRHESADQTDVHASFAGPLNWGDGDTVAEVLDIRSPLKGEQPLVDVTNDVNRLGTIFSVSRPLARATPWRPSAMLSSMPENGSCSLRPERASRRIQRHCDQSETPVGKTFASSMLPFSLATPGLLRVASMP